MANIGNTGTYSVQHKLSSRFMIFSLILLTICIFNLPSNADTSIYVFDPNQSTVIQTGGFAGVNEIYGIKGKFQLTVDFNADIASFDMVDANLTEPSGFLYTQSLGVLFNMTGLAGIVVDDATVEFEGKTSDGTESDVRLNLSLSDDSARLTGNITPPSNSADLFFYDVNALAIKKYDGGTGEPNNPYQIATAEDLMLLGESPEDYDKHFILTANIDLDPNLPGRKIFDRAVIAPDTNDINYGFQGTPFTGVFDGKEYTIWNLTITGGAYLGLFGQLGEGAEVANLGLEAANVTGTGDYVGSLVGQSAGSITTTYSKGTVTGDWRVGGLVGSQGIGDLMRGILIDCYSSGKVQGNNGVGGLTGANNGQIVESFSICTVNGTEAYTGGLVGNNWGIITASHSSGNISGNDNVGGFVGKISYGSITMSYSTGQVSGNEHVGGFVGYHDFGSIAVSFWDIETSSLTNMCGKQNSYASGCDNSYGKTTAEMQTASTFLEAGWDFADETDNGTENIWSICEGTNYPRFVWQIPAGDFVCPDGVTIDDFAFFMEHWLDVNCESSNGYCEGTDLDQSGTVDANDLEIFFENWPAEN